jgi:hypothetical protein
MFGDRRKVMVGGGIAAVLVFAIWMMWPASPPPSAAGAPSRARGGRGAASQNVSADPVPAVKLESLTASRREPAEAPRNPFRYEPKAPPPEPKLVAPPPPIDAPRAGPVVPAGPPPLPPIQLKFIGLLERADGTKWAAMTDGKGAVMQGKEGDIIDGRYRILKIGTESVEMTYVDGRGRQVIRLTGQ